MVYNGGMTKYLLFAVLFFSTVAGAQTQVLIQKPTAPVYANPSTTSEVLIVLKKGSKVSVAGVTDDGWAKVKVIVSGFQFEGWVKKDSFAKPKTTTNVAPKAAVTAKAAEPKSNLTTTTPTQLEQFFEPTLPAGSISDPVAEKNVERIEEPKKARSQNSSAGGDSWTSKKLILYGAPGYSIHQYTFSDETKDAFRYNLSGLSAMIGIEYKAFNFFDDLIRMSGQFQSQYVMYNTQTNLIDGTNTQFSDLTAKNRMMDLWFKVKIMLNFDRIVSKPFLIGFSGGYEYMKFWGDDVIDDNGTPLGLYVDQTTKSIPVGMFAELGFLDPVIMTLGSDILISNSASETPDGSSGSQPSAQTGLAPYFYLNFPIVGDEHYMGLRYQLRVQETKFTGPSSSRVNNVLNEATGLQVFHTLGLEYAYHF